jgi:hypothetical protein
MNKQYVKVLVGPHAGEIIVAIGIGVADTLEQSNRWNDPAKDHWRFYDTAKGKAQIKEVDECWARNKTDGVWVEAHHRRYTLKSEAENLGDPFDKKDREIKIGDIIVYAMRDLTVSELKVEKIKFTGMDTVLYGTDLHTGKKTKNSHPERCLKVSP